MSDNKHFDQHLKSVLEHLEPPYEPATWAALEQRLNTLPPAGLAPPGDAVDKAVSSSLQGLEAPYQSAHWNLMAARLDTLQLRLRHLRLLKLAEVFAVFLLLWNTPVFLGGPHHAPKFPTAPPPRPDVPVAQAEPGHEFPKRSTCRHNGTGATGSAYLDAALEALLREPSSPELVSNQYLTAPGAATVLQDLQHLAATASQRIYAAAEPLPLDALAALDLPQRELNLPIVPVRKVNQRGPAYFAVSGIYDQNRVLVNEKRRQSGGYGAALQLGTRGKNWGVETGIAYRSQSYVPKREVEIYAGNLSDGYVGSALTRVHNEMVTVPVKVSRRIGRLGAISAHAVAGISANIAVQKTYDYGTVYYAPNSLPPNFLPDPNQAPQLRQNGQGLLENGGLNTNFYASVDLGLRLEQPLAKGRYVAFLEPAYRQSLSGKGVGPKREPVNTLSVQAGVMAFL